jgi:hypothetical protein
VTLHDELQALLDRSMRAPQWVGFALLGLALAITLPGRHGQRLLNAALLGCGGGALAFFGLRGVAHDWIPGVSAVIASVLLALFGLVAARWATAAVVALLFAAAASLGANALHVFWPPVAVLFGGLGLFAGMVNHRGVSLVLPPIFCALFAAVGAAIAWAPHWRGAILWQLNDLDWVLGLAGIVAVILLALSLEREHRQKLRLGLKTKRMEDEALKKQVESRKAAFQKAYDRTNKLDS